MFVEGEELHIWSMFNISPVARILPNILTNLAAILLQCNIEPNPIPTSSTSHFPDKSVNFQEVEIPLQPAEESPFQSR